MVALFQFGHLIGKRTLTRPDPLRTVDMVGQRWLGLSEQFPGVL